MGKALRRLFRQTLVTAPAQHFVARSIRPKRDEFGRSGSFRHGSAHSFRTTRSASFNRASLARASHYGAQREDVPAKQRRAAQGHERSLKRGRRTQRSAFPLKAKAKRLGDCAARAFPPISSVAEAVHLRGIHAGTIGAFSMAFFRSGGAARSGDGVTAGSGQGIRLIAATCN